MHELHSFQCVFVLYALCFSLVRRTKEQRVLHSNFFIFLFCYSLEHFWTLRVQNVIVSESFGSLSLFRFSFFFLCVCTPGRQVLSISVRSCIYGKRNIEWSHEYENKWQTNKKKFGHPQQSKCEKKAHILKTSAEYVKFKWNIANIKLMNIW